MFVFSVSLDPTDPRWVGAWWIGYVAAAILAFPVFWFLLPYARELPGRYGQFCTRTFTKICFKKTLATEQNTEL